MVLAFDPECDDPALLRTVVMLLRTMTLASTRREGAQQIATAEEKIAEAAAPARQDRGREEGRRLDPAQRHQDRELVQFDLRGNPSLAGRGGGRAVGGDDG